MNFCGNPTDPAIRTDRVRWADEMVVRIANSGPAGDAAFPRTVTGSDTPAMGNRADRANQDAGDAARLADLLSRASEGDQQAWREIVDLYARRVFAMAQSHLKRADLAEEITQSVFVTVAQKLPAAGSDASGGYREQGSFEPWLFRITMNRVRDEARRAKRQATPTDTKVIADAMPSEAGSTPDIELNPELKRLREALNQLEGADREIIDMRHIGGMSFKQIAAVLDSPIGTVLARHHRALKKLRNIMESDAFGS